MSALKAYCVDAPAVRHHSDAFVLLVFAPTATRARWIAARTGLFGGLWEVPAWDLLSSLAARRVPTWDAYAVPGGVVWANSDLPSGAPSFYSDDA